MFQAKAKSETVRVCLASSELMALLRTKFDIPDDVEVSGYPITTTETGQPTGDVGPRMVLTRHGLLVEWEQNHDEQETTVSPGGVD